MADDIQIQKMDGKSLDVTGVNKEKLKTVFPECFTEGNLDIDKLLSLCGEYIDNDFEKYKFEWKGKSECLRIAGKQSTGTLRPCPEESVDFENTNNLYIEGDNLEVLKLLQTAYYRKVKMIYIDPPYNTGNDFVYEDDFKDPLAKYKEITSQTTKSNPETMGRYHTNWLNMMYPRLRLAANLLRDDGVIFISIDDNEVNNLRRVCDEVFGEENIVDCLHWKKKKQPSFLAKHTAKMMEYVVVYAKREGSLEKLSIETLSDATKKVINISNQECMRHFNAGVRVKIGNEGVIKAGRYKIKTMEVEYKQDVIYKNGRTINPVDVVSKFSVSQEKIDNFIKEDLLFITENSGLRRDVSEEEKQKRKSITDLLLSDYGDNQDSDNEQKEIFGKKYFDYSKPVKLIYNFTKSIICDDDDIVMDFFSGSATTAHSVMQLNADDGIKRQFIMVQLPELTEEKSEAYTDGYKNICEIGKERIRRAGSKIKEQNADVDVGFKVLKLDTSNLVKWDDTPLESSETDILKERFDTMIKSLKIDRNELDVVYEVMLKLGIPATYKVTENNLNGRKVYSIGEEGLVLVCLDGSNGGITPEDVTAMCELAPAKIVAAEEAFKDDVALSNAYYISKDSGVEIMLL